MCLACKPHVLYVRVPPGGVLFSNGTIEEPTASGTGSRTHRIPNDSMTLHICRSSCRRDTQKRTSQTQRATLNSKAAPFAFTFQKVMAICKDACPKSKCATNFCELATLLLPGGRQPFAPLERRNTVHCQEPATILKTFTNRIVT